MIYKNNIPKNSSYNPQNHPYSGIHIIAHITVIIQYISINVWLGPSPSPGNIALPIMYPFNQDV